jgi:hypothetical protein
MFTIQSSWSGSFGLVVTLPSFGADGPGSVPAVGVWCHILFPGEKVGAWGGGECDGVRYVGVFTNQPTGPDLLALW